MPGKDLLELMRVLSTLNRWRIKNRDCCNPVIHATQSGGLCTVLSHNDRKSRIGVQRTFESDLARR